MPAMPCNDSGEIAMSGVEDRGALVTDAGSAEGIGFATARILAERASPFQRIEDASCPSASISGPK